MFVLMAGVRDVALVFERVTILTQHFQIFWHVVIVVAVFVVHAEYFGMRIVTAPFATYETTLPHDIVARRSKCRSPYGFGRFTDARPTAVFPFLTRRSIEFCVAVRAFMCDRSTPFQRAALTAIRAVLRRISARRRHDESRRADGANFLALLQACAIMRRAPPRATLECGLAIEWDASNNRTAHDTSHVLGRVNSLLNWSVHHAFDQK